MITVTSTIRGQALFASYLQPSDRPTPAQVSAAIDEGLRRHGGVTGCVMVIAAEYGEHPDAAAARMRWALAAVSTTNAFPRSAVAA